MAYFWSYTLFLTVGFTFLRNWTGFYPESIHNKRVLITGASSGLGEQLAYRYAELGARMVITARRADVLESVVAKCKNLGAKQVTSVSADMSVADDRKRVIQVTENFLGGLDQLILNHASLPLGFWNGSEEDFRTLTHNLDVNFLSAVDLSSRALNMLIKSKGNIGVVSSLYGTIHQSQFTVYGTTKSALEGFFASLRQDLRAKGYKVSVTVCIMGLIDSDRALNMANKVYPNVTTIAATGHTADAAQTIIHGVINRYYTVYYPRWTNKFLLLFHGLFPGSVEDGFRNILYKICRVFSYMVYLDFRNFL